MNFQISGHQTALTSGTKSGTASLAEKAQDVNDLRWHLMDVWVGVEQSVIVDGVDSGADNSMPGFEPQEDILNRPIHRDKNWPKHY